MYRLYPDYWGGMPSGQMKVTQQLLNLSIYGANNTQPDWDLLAGIDQLKMSLWSITRSPIMASFNLPATDWQLALLTNKDALTLHSDGIQLRTFDGGEAGWSKWAANIEPAASTMATVASGVVAVEIGRAAGRERG